MSRSGSQTTPRTATPARVDRFDRLDALRGVALLWMAAFHFCFDLSHAALLKADFYTDPRWTTQRTLILSTFLLCAGAGQAIATAQGQSWARFWKRWAQIVVCALAVSIGSWWMFPQSYIYFGVLHGMAVMLLIARLSAPLGAWLWPLGLWVVSLPHWMSHAWFDTRPTSIVGLVTHKPITEDFVPLAPWLGVMWWGLAATQWLLRQNPGWLATPRAPGARLAQPQRVFSWLGQWSLIFYMVHQPVLLGALELYLMTRRSA
jgi:uncharacterized membrane protein